jgi:hypothetical protein
MLIVKKLILIVDNEGSLENLEHDSSILVGGEHLQKAFRKGIQVSHLTQYD